MLLFDGDDVVKGDSGADYVSGGAGYDFTDGGSEADRCLTGVDGAATYRCETTSPNLAGSAKR